MNSNFTDFTEYKILKFMGSGDGISSLKHKLDCRIAQCNAMLSHLPNINCVELLDAKSMADVLAITYIPFGKRGKTYVNNLLKDTNKTINEINKEHVLFCAKDEHISDFDLEIINLATKEFIIDLNNLPIPTFSNLPLFMFELEEMLDELNRADLWPENPMFSTRNSIMQYICYHVEKTNKLVLPEDLLIKLNSREFIKFENSPLNEKEENYLKTYLQKINFFNVL